MPFVCSAGFVLEHTGASLPALQSHVLSPAGHSCGAGEVVPSGLRAKRSNVHAYSRSSPPVVQSRPTTGSASLAALSSSA